MRPVLPNEVLAYADLLDQSDRPDQWRAKDVMASLSLHKSIGIFAPHLEALAIFREDPTVLEILWIWTHPKHRRQGKSKALLCELIRQAGLPSRKLWLETHEANAPALALYEGMGFVSVGRRERYYRDGGAAILYELSGLATL